MRRQPSAGKGPGFEAAVDASLGRLWPREPFGKSQYPSSYAGQRLWIERAGRLLGLSHAVSPRTSEAIGEDLGVPGIEHRRARQDFLTAAGLKGRGHAVVAVLESLNSDRHLFSRFLAAGCRSGCLDRAWLFDPSLKRRISPLSPLARALRRPP